MIMEWFRGENPRDYRYNNFNDNRHEIKKENFYIFEELFVVDKERIALMGARHGC